MIVLDVKKIHWLKCCIPGSPVPENVALILCLNQCTPPNVTEEMICYAPIP